MNDLVELGPCPACGDHIDYCQGHGEIADPAGNKIVQDHYIWNKHENCHPLADCEE